MTPLADRAWNLLKQRGPLSTGRIGWELWGAGDSPDLNKFARAAGKLLQEMKRQQRVHEIPMVGHSNWSAREPQGPEFQLV